jgi:lysophospholipase L1-like esterase
MRITFLGDSLTHGSFGGSFIAALREMLPQHEIVNSGRGGDTVLNWLRRLDEVLVQEPEAVFVMVGGNDAISHIYPATRPYYEQAKKIPDGEITPEQFAQAYRDLLTQLQSQHILTWVGLPPNEYSPELVAALRQYNDSAREIAELLRIGCIDFMAHFPAVDIPPRPPLGLGTINLIGKRSSSGWNDYEAARQEGGFSFTFDGLHLMPEAAQQMAGWIASFLAAQGLG